MMTTVLNLVAPIRCSGCHLPDVLLCVLCRDTMTHSSAHELRPIAVRGSRIPVISGGIYDGVRRSVVLDFKNGHRQRLASILLASVMTENQPGKVIRMSGITFVPVPPSLRGSWNRGYSPSLLLAKVLSGHSASRTPRAIVRARITPHKILRPTPSSRSRGERLRRSARDYRVGWASEVGSVVVVDDVMATGATVRAVCESLSLAGYTPRAVVVAAHVPDFVTD